MAGARSMTRVGLGRFLFVVSCERNKDGALTVTPDLHIEILHNEITVTMPGTTYKVTYYKPRGSRILLAKHQSSTSDGQATLKLSEFLGGAWWAASDKARELGWID